MSNPSPPNAPKLTMEQETYWRVRKILQAIHPLASLAERTTGTAEMDGWADRMISLMESLLEGQTALRKEVEQLNGRLDAPEMDYLLTASAARP